MPRSQSTTLPSWVVAAVLLYPWSVSAVSLTDVNSNLMGSFTSLLTPTACKTLMNQAIPGCVASDFTNGCSESCLEGVRNTNAAAQTACRSGGLLSNLLGGLSGANSAANGGILNLCSVVARPVNTVADPAPAADAQPSPSQQETTEQQRQQPTSTPEPAQPSPEQTSTPTPSPTPEPSPTPSPSPEPAAPAPAPSSSPAPAPAAAPAPAPASKAPAESPKAAESPSPVPQPAAAQPAAQPAPQRASPSPAPAAPKSPKGDPKGSPVAAPPAQSPPVQPTPAQPSKEPEQTVVVSTAVVTPVPASAALLPLGAILPAVGSIVPAASILSAANSAATELLPTSAETHTTPAEPQSTHSESQPTPAGPMSTPTEVVSTVSRKPTAASESTTADTPLETPSTPLLASFSLPDPSSTESTMSTTETPIPLSLVPILPFGAIASAVVASQASNGSFASPTAAAASETSASSSMPTLVLSGGGFNFSLPANQSEVSTSSETGSSNQGDSLVQVSQTTQTASSTSGTHASSSSSAKSVKTTSQPTANVKAGNSPKISDATRTDSVLPGFGAVTGAMSADSATAYRMHSRGSIAGIVIGCLAVFILLLILGTWLLFRQRRKLREARLRQDYTVYTPSDRAPPANYNPRQFPTYHKTHMFQQQASTNLIPHPASFTPVLPRPPRPRTPGRNNSEVSQLEEGTLNPFRDRSSSVYSVSPIVRESNGSELSIWYSENGFDQYLPRIPTGLSPISPEDGDEEEGEGVGTTAGGIDTSRSMTTIQETQELDGENTCIFELPGSDQFLPRTMEEKKSWP